MEEKNKRITNQQFYANQILYDNAVFPLLSLSVYKQNVICFKLEKSKEKDTSSMFSRGGKMGGQGNGSERVPFEYELKRVGLSKPGP